jgi:hypothetical protein
MKNTKINFLLILVLLLGNLSKAQTSGADKKTVSEEPYYWFATGIEKQGADLLLDNPTVFTEIITVKCDRSYAPLIADKFEKFFEDNYASKLGVSGIYVYPNAFLTLAEAQAKRNELKANVESKNAQIYWVSDFKVICN